MEMDYIEKLERSGYGLIREAKHSKRTDWAAFVFMVLAVGAWAALIIIIN